MTYRENRLVFSINQTSPEDSKLWHQPHLVSLAYPRIFSNLHTEAQRLLPGLLRPYQLKAVVSESQTTMLKDGASEIYPLHYLMS